MLPAVWPPRAGPTQLLLIFVELTLLESHLRRQGLRPRKEAATAPIRGVFRWCIFNRKGTGDASQQEGNRLSRAHLWAPNCEKSSHCPWSCPSSLVACQRCLLRFDQWLAVPSQELGSLVRVPFGGSTITIPLNGLSCWAPAGLTSEDVFVATVATHCVPRLGLGIRLSCYMSSLEESSTTLWGDFCGSIP